MIEVRGVVKNGITFLLRELMSTAQYWSNKVYYFKTFREQESSMWKIDYESNDHVSEIKGNGDAW